MFNSFLATMLILPMFHVVLTDYYASTHLS